MVEELDCGRRLGGKQRLISLAECVVGVFLVLGHNSGGCCRMRSFFCLDWAWCRSGCETAELPALACGVRDHGLDGVCGNRHGNSEQVEDVVTDPISRLFTHEPRHVSTILQHPHDLRKSLIALGIVWTFAAFGEEIGYRGYLMTRFGEMAGGGRIGKTVSLVMVSLLFGFGHFYKGPAGIVESTASGVLLGTVYLVTGNLWGPILAHGFADTIAVAAVYFGWA